MNKRAVVSFANQRGRYIQNLARLSESLRNNFTTGEFIGFINEDSFGAPKHEEDPYSFKINCFEAALASGYTSVLYLDSSVFAVKNIDTLFDKIEEDGFLAQMAGYNCAEWSNDFVLKYHGISRDEAEKMPMIGNAGMLALDFTQEKPTEFFELWRDSQEAGCFKGAWNNIDGSESSDPRCKGSRHDMSNSSILANKLGLIDLAVAGDQILQYAGPYDEIAHSNIYFKAQG